jgi:23S rRNA pseudouridine1911/1915/1917 synthase
VYWALVESEPPEPSGVLEHYLRHDERHRRVHVTNPEAAGAQFARLTYRVLGPAGDAWRLEIEPETGRKHQIRVQLAKAGWPIVGDRKYGGRQPFSHGIALHARQLVVEHPVQKTQIELVAPLPGSWSKSAKHWSGT